MHAGKNDERTTYVFEDFDDDETKAAEDNSQRHSRYNINSVSPDKVTISARKKNSKSPVGRRLSFSQANALRESLEIIEDADEIEEEEAETSSLNDEHQPVP